MSSILKFIVELLEALFGKKQNPLPPVPQPENSIPPVQPETPQVVVKPEPIPEPAAEQVNFVSKNTNKLSEIDYQNAAKLLDVEVACVKAVTTVESSGGGFLVSGKPKILLEAHLFAKLTGQKYNSSYPNISSPKWNKALYAGGEKEYPRLLLAMSLDEEAALKSTSWGLFQILGMNHKACGFDDVKSFVKAQVESETKQLQSFILFLKSNGLDKHLKSKDWTAFARGYNGPGFAANSYDVKLKAAYEKFSK